MPKIVNLRILDPAVGSAHFLLNCFDLLLIIYEEAWADPDLGPALQVDYHDWEAYCHAIPGMILRYNLHGIDIDPRAVQIAALALWLRAQKTWKNLGLKAPEGPRIARSNIVTAEPMHENVPQEAVIETWDPEMGFLTDHNYHYPPNALLAVAIEQVNYGGEPVQGHSDFLQTQNPEYLLMGEFSKWTEMYSFEYVQENYQLMQSFGDYDLDQRVK